MFRKTKQPVSERQAAKEPDYDGCFRVACEAVLCEIEGLDGIAATELERLLRPLESDTKKQISELIRHLGECPWRWPVYESYERGKQDVLHEAAAADIRSLTAHELLDKFAMARLKDLHAAVIGTKAPSTLKKKALVDAIAGTAPESHLEPQRAELIDKLDDPSILDKERMAGALIRRIRNMAHSWHRRQQMLAIADRRPYWEFVADEMRGSAPAECKGLNGITRRYDDTFWEAHYPPCWRPDCHCRVASLSARERLRRENCSG